MRVKIIKVNTELRSWTDKIHHEIWVSETPKEGDRYTPIYGPFYVKNQKDYDVGQELDLRLCKVYSDGKNSDIEVE